MILYLPICFILAILGTLLANPAFYYHLFQNRKRYKLALKNSKTIRKSDYSIFYDGEISIALVIGQCISFVVFFAISAFILCSMISLRFSTILAYLWIPAFAQLLNLLFWTNHGSVETSFECINNTEDNILRATIILTIIFFIIPIAIGVHKGVYNYLNPYDNITFLEEAYCEYPSVDETKLLEVANIADGSSLEDPIYRNGSWIYPVKNSNSHVSSSGYLIVDSAGKNFTFVAKDIIYSPWSSSKTDIGIVLRKLMPSAVFFGNTTFQVEPGTGDVYFCKFYGDYACFRAGRDVKGLILINATTGECQIHPISKIPSWITGISF